HLAGDPLHIVERLGHGAPRYRDKHNVCVGDVPTVPADPRHLVPRLLPQVAQAAADVAPPHRRDLHPTLLSVYRCTNGLARLFRPGHPTKLPCAWRGSTPPSSSSSAIPRSSASTRSAGTSRRSSSPSSST